MKHYIYITLMTIVFVAFTVVFDTFPRSTVSELERRELAVFPEYTSEKLCDGSFTREISSWFSDSEPFRDDLMALSMYIKSYMGLAKSEDDVTFHASKDVQPDGDAGEEIDSALIKERQNRDIGEYENHVTADDNAKIANAGIVVVGTGDNVRALMAYGGGPKGGVKYAEAANKYKERFGNGVNVYCMVIPTAIEYYCPDKVKRYTNSQLLTIRNIFAHLSESVKAVDIYTTLGKHAGEDIYLRTDHHWAPLGAYYAAEEFARVAGVPFMPLKDYERRVVHRYVGSMYGYSKDISIKNAPEDFVYYMPRGVECTTTYITYTIDKNYHVTGESRPMRGVFFMHYRDGNGGAYCTFMGGDTKITQVRTSVKNGRRVMILKDSFGNALPGYLFGSFEEVHVVDSRYFTKNMVQYVHDNRITDILFANNIFNAYSPRIANAYIRFLDQAGGIVKHRTDSTSVTAPADVHDRQKAVGADTAGHAGTGKPVHPEEAPVQQADPSTESAGSAFVGQPDNTSSTEQE